MGIVCESNICSHNELISVILLNIRFLSFLILSITIFI